MSIYHIDASPRTGNSVSRKFTRVIVDELIKTRQQKVIYRDLGRAEGIRLIDETIAGAIFLPESDRSPDQRSALLPSDKIIEEAVSSDIWVLGIPIYNFSVPASFKAWADMLARSKKTFQYGDKGPEGLLKNKTVFAVIASGGTEIDSSFDFCTPWLRHFLSFLGIDKINIIRADQYSPEKEEKILQSIAAEVSKYGV